VLWGIFSSIFYPFPNEVQAITMSHVRANNAAVEKQKRIAHSECVFVALSIQDAMRICHIICGLPRSTKFFYFILQTA
jgi:uncharacterized membrane protein